MTDEQLQAIKARRAAAERAQLESRISGAEVAVSHALRQLPAPKPEKLRVLMLGASAEGDLRVGREQKRIRAAVESALHRDQIELAVRAAAPTADPVSFNKPPPPRTLPTSYCLLFP